MLSPSGRASFVVGVNRDESEGEHMPRDSARIAHNHESVPFYMDGSLEAAVDLKP
jgi:hypothetical protein